MKFPGTRIWYSGSISGIFNDGNLHAQAYAKIRDFFFSGIAGCQDHPFYAPVSEASGNQDAVKAG